MNSFQELTDSVADMKIFIIGISALLFISICFIFYNMYRIYSKTQDDSDTHQQYLMDISMNKNDLKLLKRYVDEEKDKLEGSIGNKFNELNRLKGDVAVNKTNISNNRTLITTKTDTITNKFDDMDLRIKKNKDDISSIDNKMVLNSTKLSSFESDIDSYKTSQSSIIENIKQKQDAIQKNIGTFSYNDFEVLSQRVGSNNILLNNMNDAISQNIKNIDENERLISNIQEEVSNIDFVDNTELNRFFQSQILPLINKNETDIVGLNTNVVNIQNTYVNKDFLKDNYMASSEIQTTYALLEDLNDNYMKSSDIESTFAKKSELQDNYMTKSNIQKEFVSKPELQDKGYLNKNEIELQFASKSDMNNYMTSSDIESTFAKIADVEGNYMTNEKLFKTFHSIDEEKISVM